MIGICDECDRESVGLIKFSETTKYLCNSHYRKAIEEHAELIEEKRLLPQ